MTLQKYLLAKKTKNSNDKKTKTIVLMPNVVEQETSITTPVNCIINKNRSIISSSLEV